MIYWFRDTCGAIFFRDGGNKPIKEILSSIKDNLYLFDFDSAGEQEYEIVFFDGVKIHKIIKLTHSWYWTWDNQEYVNVANNIFYEDEVDRTEDLDLINLDYILKYKMGVIE